MIKRDRAARAKKAGEADAADAADSISLEKADELESVTELDDAGDDAPVRPSGKRRRGSSSATAVVDRPAKSKAVATDRNRNPFAALWLFLQQVVAELKKVIWPTRRDTIVYTIVVLVFVVIATALIAGLDIGFARLVLLVFG
ncbi:preprotein translocase SecE subunit [Gordonia effusa NBRC 100432]|uniref:Protein translocase subunit SecE n=1 Tax=Gordonia effusa NBRC 100432 TaxID=1077974 RepID=H0QYU2_9ACTN|nr:preprotein translocase subunit SecE [Gordonia effusa]GAB17993.1 preprotein translocase SecE subunit [Gordonia effusa NBRC 100432]